jgi:hypothetical protein
VESEAARDGGREAVVVGDGGREAGVEHDGGRVARVAPVVGEPGGGAPALIHNRCTRLWVRPAEEHLRRYSKCIR